MKALVLNAVGRGFDYEDVDIAAPIGREVLVDVRASGLCHTDMLFATNNIFPTPSVLGHEVAGVAAAVGPDTAQIQVGDHVVGSLAQSCGTCARCQSGRSFQCRRPEATLRKPDEAPRLSRKGVGLFQGLGLGGFAERALIHENQLAVVPKEMPFSQAALLGCGVVTGTGGEGHPEGFKDGYFVKPTVFVNATNDMAIAQEEIFGPVLCVIAYDSEDDAIRIANDSKYGLHGAVLGADVQRARRVASQIRSGRVVINSMMDDPQAPWGGFKYSGVGREYGRYGIEAFLETRAILE